MPLRNRIVIVLVAVATVAPVASAQRLLGPPGDRTGAAVSVRVSVDAADRLVLGERMERLKEWEKSADVYQEVVEKYADRVVSSGSGDGGPTRYVSVILEVQRRLGKWPAEGLRVYRTRYEAPATAMLEAAGGDDVAGLNKVVQLYFPTDAAKAAGLRLMELYIENGEFAAAAWMGQRLLDNHPGLAADEPKLLFRTALAQHMSGDDAAARAKLDQLKQRHADAKGTIAGKEVLLADELAKLLDAPVPVAHGSGADSWPMFGGDPTRGRVPTAAGRPGAKVADIPLPRFKPLPGTDARARSDSQQERQRREGGLSLGIMPAIDRGELFYQDNSRVYAASADSGLPLPGWSITYGTDTRPRYSGAALAWLTPNLQMCVAVTDNAVLAILGQAEKAVVPNENGQPVAIPRDIQLVCLDRVSGAKRWTTSSSQFPDAAGNQQPLDLIGTPLVVGDNVYVQARRITQSDDSYVVCLNLADGKLRWSCYLASGGTPDGSAPRALGEAVSHLAYSGGRVYACTNVGAVAAVDAYSGTIAWLSLYPKPPQANNLGGGGFGGFQGAGGVDPGGTRKPWAQNPVIVRDGKVYALPTDAELLMVYDAASGEEIKRIATSAFDSADTLLGVIGDRLILASLNTVFCVHWPSFDVNKPEQSLAWKSGLSGPGTVDEQKDTIRGRAFVTADSIFVPTKWDLRRIDLARGKVEGKYPADAAWGAGEGPGNVLVTQDQVIIAGADNISVYSDLSLARAKLDRAVAAAPNDPMPRLKYSETLFAAGQIDLAVTKLDEAIALLGGMGGMRPGPERDRAFSRALTFAERFANPSAGASDPARANDLYDRAAAAAGSAPQQVAYRLSRARFARGQRDFVSEVRLYQEILANAQYREINVPAEDSSGSASAGNIAQAAIKVRLRDYPAAYQPFEQAATAALAAAKAAKDPEQMRAVAEIYPNARVAPEAMLAAADAYEAAGNNRRATQMLNEIYHNYRDSADRARILEAQARNYLALPAGVGSAIAKLNEGAKLHDTVPHLTRPLRLPDGTTIENLSFAAAAELLQKYSTRLAQTPLPDFRLPIPRKQALKPFLPSREDQVLHDVDALVLPPVQLRNFGRNDRVVAWNNEKALLSIYAVGTNTPVATSDALKQAPHNGVWAGTDFLVWSADQVVLLRGDSGAQAWSQEIKALPAAEAVEGEGVMARGGARDDGRADGGEQQQGVVVGPNGVPMDTRQFQRLQRMQQARAQVERRRRVQQNDGAEHIEYVCPVGDRIVVGTSQGRLAAIDMSDGRLAWQRKVGDAPLDQVVSSDDFVAARFTDDAGTQIVALDAFTGAEAMRKSFPSEPARMPINMALSPDGTLIYTLPDRICAKDLYQHGTTLKFGEQSMSDGNSVFDNARLPDQLAIVEGQILAVADNGQFVRVLSLEDGHQLRQPLSTQSQSWDVHLSLVGSRLYVRNQKTVYGYSLLDPPDDPWGREADDPRGTPSIQDAFIGKRHIVLLDQPAPRDGQPAAASARVRLMAYGRYPVGNPPHGESGRLDHDPFIPEPAGIDQWQAVEGGFYYHSLDRRAHFLAGADRAAAENPQ